MFYRRYDEFELRAPTYIGEVKNDKYLFFPYKIDVVKWSDDGNSCYSIGTLIWDDRNDEWNFNSIGLRYLNNGDRKSTKLILDFCENYGVDDRNGQLYEY